MKKSLSSIIPARYWCTDMTCALRDTGFPSAEEGETVPWWDTRAYQYNLPSELIAQQPAARRDASRLLVYSRQQHKIDHHVFHDLPSFLKSGDTLVLNDCLVIPARLYARRQDTGTEVEILVTHARSETEWEALVKPGRSCKAGVKLCVGDSTVEVRSVCEDGSRIIRFNCSAEKVEHLFATCGVMPLPPYISRPHVSSSEHDRQRYQTVYARSGQAVAAPTAGLHFTPELLEKIGRQGCSIVYVTLDVGPGTFQPVKTTDIREHKMHTERFEFSRASAETVNQTRSKGGRIIAVGTTSLRVLEACMDDTGTFQARSGTTDIFIHPPYRIRAIDGLITNFHLPQSTLLMLVAAWLGMDGWRRVYAEAVACGYRFYSYGDSMLLQ